jgi:hypothetical protein
MPHVSLIVQLGIARKRQLQIMLIGKVLILVGLVPPWEHIEPVWELRVGEYRVFYDVNEETAVVMIRAIRHKPPHKTTEEIL